MTALPPYDRKLSRIFVALNQLLQYKYVANLYKLLTFTRTQLFLDPAEGIIVLHMGEHELDVPDPQHVYMASSGSLLHR